MTWQVSYSVITPKGTTPFDEWFDSLPLDYFKDNPDAKGKNKFELLEESLSPPDPDPPLRILKEVSPLSSETTTSENETSVITTTTTVWESRRVYEIWNQQHNVIYNYKNGTDGLAITLEGLEYADVINLQYEDYKHLLPSNYLEEKPERNYWPSSDEISFRNQPGPFLNNFYNSVFGITNRSEEKEV